MPFPGAQVPQGDTEPQMVLYRDITIHNPRYSGKLFVDGYTHDLIQRDIQAIKNAKDAKHRAWGCFPLLESILTFYIHSN